MLLRRETAMQDAAPSINDSSVSFSSSEILPLEKIHKITENL